MKSNLQLLEMEVRFHTWKHLVYGIQQIKQLMHYSISWLFLSLLLLESSLHLKLLYTIIKIFIVSDFVLQEKRWNRPHTCLRFPLKAA